METNWVPLLVAVLGAGGIGAAIREIIGVIALARKGVSGKEQKRRDDIIAQRDYAIAQMEAARREADQADQRADEERDERIRWREYAAQLRMRLIFAGSEPGDWPTETTEPTRKETS